MQRLTLAADATPLRLDRFLCEQLSGVSRRSAKELIAAGRVRIDGRRARKGQEVTPGSLVEVEDAAEESSSLRPNADLELRILHADAAVVAVDKPAGMPTHALRLSDTDTAANFLLARYPEVATLGKALEPGLVHRLDNDTSGVLLAARTAAAHISLRQQFSHHRVVKKYLALVRGDVTQAAAVDAPIEHAGARRMRLAEPGSGRDAITHYLPLRRFGSLTLVEVEIRTGVRHQIRVHLAAIGHPVAGDVLYDEAAEATIDHHLLHAAAVTFVHPETGEKVTIRSELPEDFRQQLGKWD